MARWAHTTVYRRHAAAQGAWRRRARGAILGSALDAVIAMDERGRVTEFNPAAERMFGCPHHAALGQELAALIMPPALREPHRRGLARHLAAGGGALLGKRSETTAMRADGHEFPVEIYVLPTAGGYPASCRP